jgi:hypothetical protein
MPKHEKHFWHTTIDKEDKFIISVGYEIYFAFEAYVLSTYLQNFSSYITKDTTYPLKRSYVTTLYAENHMKYINCICSNSCAFKGFKDKLFQAVHTLQFCKTLLEIRKQFLKLLIAYIPLKKEKIFIFTWSACVCVCVCVCVCMSFSI